MDAIDAMAFAEFLKRYYWTKRWIPNYSRALHQS